MKNIKIYLVCLLAFGLLLAAEPKRIVLNLTDTPEKSVALSFRFYEPLDTAFVQYCINTDGVKLHTTAEKHAVLPQAVFADTNKTVTQFACSYIIKDLEPGVSYAYRVGDGQTWTEWYTFKTAEKKKYDFSIVYLGDPQWGYVDYLPRLYAEAIRTAPDAAFWYCAGDVVDYPYEDWQWDAYFKGAEEAFTRYPHIFAAGNHAYLWAYRDHRDSLPDTWRPHFTQPENGPEGLEETCFYVDYQGVRFIVLNGNENFEKQAVWLKKVLKKNRNKWTVVGVHQGFYPSGWERDYPEYRDYFIPLFEKYGVDMVLQGHDHAYTRTYALKDGKAVKDHAKGVCYTISVAGSKQYPIKSKFTDLFEVSAAEGKQYFQTLEFSKDSLVYKSYTVSGICHDKYVIIK